MAVFNTIGLRKRHNFSMAWIDWFPLLPLVSEPH
jgi:hypothetical protein